MPEVVLIADDAGASLSGVLDVTTSATLLALGHDAEALAHEHPAAVSRVIGLPALSWTVPTDALGRALLPFLADALVVVESHQAGRDLAGWLVGAADAAIVWAVDAVRIDGESVELDRVVQGGSQRMVHSVGSGMTVVVAKPATTGARSVEGSPGARHETRADVVPGPSRVTVDVAPGPSVNGTSLRGAAIVVSVGRGIGGPQHVAPFEQLADRLGAALGASRVAVDAGWVPFARQVGQTGVAVSPDVYIGFGISGAIQHLAGMRGSGTVVAVNTDPDAPLCQLADLVVVGDAVEVAEALLKRLAERG